MVHPDMTVDQEDGARWSVFYNPHHLEGYTILTSEGNTLVQNQNENELRSLVHRYRAAEFGGIALFGEDSTMRQELGRGTEAIVYRMGQFAVREQVGLIGMYVALGELQRMDAINGVIEHGLPRWLHIPSHYALHADPKQQKTYTLMDRVDGGITVEDVVGYPNAIQKKRAHVVEKDLGEHIDEAQEQVPELYDRAHIILSDAIRDAGKLPESYLTDWKPRNVVIERLSTPVAGSNYNLNVIDQYAAR